MFSFAYAFLVAVGLLVAKVIPANSSILQAATDNDSFSMLDLHVQQSIYLALGIPASHITV